MNIERQNDSRLFVNNEVVVVVVCRGLLRRKAVNSRVTVHNSGIDHRKIENKSPNLNDDC